MRQCNKIASFAVLSLAMATTAVGCVASPGAEDEARDEAVIADDGAEPAVVAPLNDERTGEARQAWWPFGCAAGFPFFRGPLYPFFDACGGGCGGCF